MFIRIITQPINVMIKMISRFSLLLFSLIILIAPVELFSQSNSYTNAQIQQIEQNLLESLVEEDHDEFLHNLDKLREAGVPVHHELLYYEAHAHYQLSNFTDAQFAIGFYLDHTDGQLNQKRNAETLLTQLEDINREMLEEENQLYGRVLNYKKLNDFREYIRRYPNGSYSDEIHEMYEVYDDESFGIAQQKDTREAYNQYLEIFPTGMHVLEAHKRITHFDEIVFEVVEEMPKLIGGNASIANQIEYPEIARRAGITGRVFVRLIVDETGRVSEAEIIRGLGNDEINKEALRVIRNARFVPSRQRGRPVKVKMTMPILFSLE